MFTSKWGRARGGILAVMALALTGPPGVRADDVFNARCNEITFETYALDTVITTQYAGVSFSSFGPCSGSDVVIVNPPGGSSSEYRAVHVTEGTGCEFSPNGIRMVFAAPQKNVTFTVGGAATIAVKAYNESGAQVGATQNVTPDPLGVYRTVRVTAGTLVIKRIEVQATFDNDEFLDDLVFEDHTPPQTWISAPAFLQCVCDSVAVRGRTCDPDGYMLDRLEVQPSDADPNDPWLFVGQYTTPVCEDDGYLYNWDTTDPNFGVTGDGFWTLRLTTVNACGQVSTDYQTVRVDREFDTIDIRKPAAAGCYGGLMCMDGTVFDPYCFDHYTVEYKPLNGVYTLLLNSDSYVINDPIVTWDTTAVPDGAYGLRVIGTTTCGNTKSATRTIEIDNTPATAMIEKPLPCAYIGGDYEIRGRAFDGCFDRFELAFVGGPYDDWQPIGAPGYTPVPGPNGLLGVWQTTDLPDCAYVIRLRVYTNTEINCEGDVQYSDDYVAVILTCPGDIDFSGDVGQSDLGILLSNYGEECP